MNDVAFTRNDQAVRGFFDKRTSGLKFITKRRNQITAPAQQFNFATRNYRRKHICAKLDPIGHDLMRRTTKTIHALNGQGGGALPFDLRTHCPQAFRQINDLGLPRHVFQNRSTLG